MTYTDLHFEVWVLVGVSPIHYFPLGQFFHIKIAIRKVLFTTDIDQHRLERMVKNTEVCDVGKKDRRQVSQ